jgi:type I restriction enzyme S subunit
MTSKPPFGGEVVSFSEAFAEVSRGVRKVKQKDYLLTGAHPIVDQGQELIAGYSNEGEGLFEDVPALVFGDHTRCVKYVDEPFFAGADGVKILKPKLSDNVHYWYHALRNTPLENLGYSRHFKLLKQASFVNRDAAEQAAIVERLDAIEGLQDTVDRQLAALDSLVKSRFVEMFGGREWPKRQASSFMRNVRNGVSPSKNGECHARVLTLSALTQGSFDASAYKEGAFKDTPPADKRITKGLFCICRGNGNKALVGTAEYAESDDPQLVFPDTVIAAEIDQSVVCLPYLAAAWKRPSTRVQIEARARTTNGTFKINQEVVRSIELPLPPLALQREFADFAARVDKLRFMHLVTAPDNRRIEGGRLL